MCIPNAWRPFSAARRHERRPQHPSRNRMFREYSWLTGNVGISTANWFSILKILWIVHTVYLIFAVPVLCLIIHETPISVAIFVLVRVRALLRELHGVCDDLTLAEQSEWSKLTIDQGNLINITLHYEQPLKNIVRLRRSTPTMSYLVKELRKTWTSKYKDCHILLWSNCRVPTFENWFRK